MNIRASILLLIAMVGLLVAFHVVLSELTYLQTEAASLELLRTEIRATRQAITEIGISYCNLTKQCEQLSDGRIKLP